MVKKIIDHQDLIVQIEKDVVPMWVDDSIAVDIPENRMDWQSDQGIMWVATRDSQYERSKSGATHIANTLSRRRMDTDEKGNDYYVSDDIGAFHSAGYGTGPLLAQTRIPIPTLIGNKINFSGKVVVRKPAKMTTPIGLETKIASEMFIRFSIWGLGKVVDEYGDQKINAQELMFFESGFIGNEGFLTTNVFTMPTLPDATVPKDVDYIVMTINYLTGGVVGRTFPKASYEIENYRAGGSTGGPGWKAILFDTTGAGIRINQKNSNGIVFLNDQPVFKNKTGWYLTTEGQINIDFVKNTSNYSVDIYDWNPDTDTNGAKLSTTLIDSNKTVTINAPGKYINIVSPSDIYIRKITRSVYKDMTVLQNNSRRSIFKDITLDCAKVSIIRKEAASGSATINIESFDLDTQNSDLIRVGKVVRIFGVGSGGPKELFTGEIRSITGMYDALEHMPLIQIVAYDTYEKMKQTKDCPAFEVYDRYIPFITTYGNDFVINGQLYNGIMDMPDWRAHFPPSYGLTMFDAIMATRNVLKGVVYVNKLNQVIMNNLIDRTIKWRFSDIAGQGDFNYGDAKINTDTSTFINTITLEEGGIDRKQFLDKESSQPTDLFPVLNEYPEKKEQTATFTSDVDVEYVNQSVSFKVVKGNGYFRDILLNKYNWSGKDWADAILDDNSNYQPQLESISVPVDSKELVDKISSIEMMDFIELKYKNQTYQNHIREIDMTITPGKWTVELTFKRDQNSIYW